MKYEMNDEIYDRIMLVTKWEAHCWLKNDEEHCNLDGTIRKDISNSISLDGISIRCGVPGCQWNSTIPYSRVIKRDDKSRKKETV